mgnify:CR=1 FL=1
MNTYSTIDNSLERAEAVKEEVGRVEEVGGGAVALEGA